MKKTYFLCVSCIIAAMCMLLLQSCGGNKRLARSDFEKIRRVQVVWYKTQDFEIKTVGGAILRGPVLLSLLSPVGDKMIRNKTHELLQDTMLPDMGRMEAEQFVKVASEVIPNWSVTVTKNNPIEKDFEHDGTLVVFRSSGGSIENDGEFALQGLVSVKDDKNREIFNKSFLYASRFMKIKRSREEYLADNCKLLREEMLIAVKYVINEIIQDIKS